MARGAADQANQAVKKENALSDQYNAKANDLFSTLAPIYQDEATNPQGFAPEDKAAMDTASQQSLGGSVAGTVGQGNLEAARTRNAGAFQPALSESSRSAQRQLSTNAVGTQEKSAMLKEANSEAGISGMQGLYGQNASETLAAMGLVPGTINARTNASPGWFQNMTSLITALKSGGGGQSGGVPGAFGG